MIASLNKLVLIRLTFTDSVCSTASRRTGYRFLPANRLPFTRLLSERVRRRKDAVLCPAVPLLAEVSVCLARVQSPCVSPRPKALFDVHLFSPTRHETVEGARHHFQMLLLWWMKKSASLAAFPFPLNPDHVHSFDQTHLS